MIKKLLISTTLLAAALPGQAHASTPVTIHVDARADRKPIHPEIYGVSFGDAKSIAELHCPIDRSGGNSMTRYNWKLNSDNRANDWFFESLPDDDPTPGARVDNFIRDSKKNGAQPMVTIPMLGWVGRLGPHREKLASFSIKKYGPEQKSDPYWPDGGNGVKPDGTPITGNDPAEANVKATPQFQKGWVRHIVSKWGASKHGGVRYYLLDNEPSLWHATHRDVHPQGETLDEILADSVAYSTMIKSVDPGALTAGPEEWGWPGYSYSGADQDWGNKHHWPKERPDRQAHGDEDYIPWYLDQMRIAGKKAHKRLLDILTVHIYPQGGEDNGGDVSEAIQLKRNRSTRAFWDPNYVDESWINSKVMLIPRLHGWVKEHYPGTKIGITEYNWGAEKSMSGAMAEADILGIFGREGLDLACRWTCPDKSTPTFQAMKIYRNYNGHGAGFGDISVRDTVPNPDNVSSFAAVRNSDGALTVVVINKQLHEAADVHVDIRGFALSHRAQAWQIADNKPIAALPDVPLDGPAISTIVPARSITLFVVEPR
jgi:hypothetical protein